MSAIDKSMVNLLTEGQIAELKEVFEIFDIDQDGSVSTDELGLILSSLGQNISKSKLNNLISKVDSDENKKLDFSEFLLLITQKMLEDDENYDYYKIFKSFDKDDNGVISRFELKLALMRKVKQEKLVNYFITQADSDGDGNINFNEFVNYMKSLPIESEQ